MIDEKLLVKLFSFTEGYSIKNNKIDSNGSVGSYSIRKLKTIPFQFNNVNGSFRIDLLGVISLKGSPIFVGNDFSCRANKITNFIGGPIHINGSFDAINNKHVTSLQGLPDYVGRNIEIEWLPNLPILPLLTKPYFVERNSWPDPVWQILLTYYRKKPLKKSILACQKELITAGFVGNASW
jgi:hypothetical protein